MGGTITADLMVGSVGIRLDGDGSPLPGVIRTGQSDLPSIEGFFSTPYVVVIFLQVASDGVSQFLSPSKHERSHQIQNYDSTSFVVR